MEQDYRKSFLFGYDFEEVSLGFTIVDNLTEFSQRCT